ncbi:hypothetical protein GCM10010106_08680 [Thermopolyspora flexuosa]|nr:hypothetical protein GCM10010106_08680 [Thermopolyspora flexuosa]
MRNITHNINTCRQTRKARRTPPARPAGTNPYVEAAASGQDRAACSERLTSIQRSSVAAAAPESIACAARS